MLDCFDPKLEGAVEIREVLDWLSNLALVVELSKCVGLETFLEVRESKGPSIADVLKIDVFAASNGNEVEVVDWKRDGAELVKELSRISLRVRFGNRVDVLVVSERQHFR